MQIDRAYIEQRLAEVRAQGQQALSIFQQAQGAEKALNGMLQHLDAEPEVPEKEAPPKPLGEMTLDEMDAYEAERIKPRGTSARKSHNGATQ